MKYFFFKIFLMLLFCLCCNQVFAQWQSVGANGLVAAKATDQSIAIANNGTPYVAYRDEANGFKATVKKFNGISWEVVGASFSASYASSLSLALDKNDVPHVAFIDLGNDAKAVVKKLSGSNWAVVGTTDFAANYATGISLLMDKKGTPYVAFSDKNDNNKAIVKKFNGSNWENVGSASISAGAANSLAFALNFKGMPYVAYADEAIGGQATVKSFNGSHWVNVGVAGFTEYYVTGLSLAIDNTGTPYMLYRDEENNYKATVKKFDGNNWVSVGNAGFSAGFIDNAALAVGGTGTPYVSYVDYGNGAIGNNGSVQVKRFVGSHWESVGPAGLNTSNTFDLALTLDANSLPYLSYSDKAAGYNATVINLASSVPFFTAISDNSGSQEDIITTDRTLILSGNSLANANIRVFKNDVLIGQTTANADGKWNFDYSNTSLGDGNHIFTATAILNGLTSKPSANYVVTIDGTAPQTPVLTYINKQKVDSAAIYLNSKANFKGTVEANAQVTLYAGATKIGSALADSTGAWEMADITLADNNYTITAMATDAAGNVSSASQPINIAVDTKAPAVPTLALAAVSNVNAHNVNEVHLNAQAFGGIATTANLNTATPTLTGKAEANAAIVINVDGITSAITPADNTGNWTYTFVSPLAAGKRNVTVNALDKANNSSEQSAALRLLIDITAPVVTGVSEGGLYNTERRILFNEGKATLNNKAFGSNTKISAEGKYTLVVTDAAGNITTVNFAIDKTKPVGQAIVNNKAPYTNSAEVTLDITETGEATQMRFMGNNGVWTDWEPVASTKTWTLPATNGSKIISVQLRDAAGNISVTFYGRIILDQKVPTTTISTTTAGPTNATAIPVKVLFSEVVTGFDITDVAVSNGVISNFAGRFNAYTFTVKPIASGTVTVKVAAGITEDVAGNNNLESKTLSIDYVALAAPTVTTNEINSVGDSFVTLGGHVTASGNVNVTDRGVVYSKASTPTISNTKVNMGSGIGTFSQSVTGLAEGTYYVRAYATNSKGTAYGSVQTFTILDRTAPVVNGVSEGGLYNINKRITFDEGTATLNNIVFGNGSTVSADGTYTLVVTDADKNVTTVRFAIDKTKPSGTLVINNNALVTKTVNVTLTLTFKGEPVEMRFKGADWGAWEPVATTKTWTLAAGNGTKSASVQFRDAAGNISASAYDLITLKESALTAPTQQTAARQVQEVKEVAAGNIVAVYPNPATTQLHVEVSEAGTGETTINLLDMTGKIALSQKVNTTTSLTTVLDVDQLQPGVYVLSINTPQGRISRRVVIK